MPVAATCADPHPVHTIGHSTREIDAFLDLLGAHAVDVVVDVRRWPASRRHPHFAREALEPSLGTAGIAYVWRRDLGGFRTPAPDSTNIGWRVKAFRGYADFMLTPEFERAMGRWLSEGRVHNLETVRSGGITEAFDAFLGMLTGQDVGKTVVTLT